jgi:hypothetical protein
VNDLGEMRSGRFERENAEFFAINLQVISRRFRAGFSREIGSEKPFAAGLEDLANGLATLLGWFGSMGG